MNKIKYYDCHCHILPDLDDGPKTIDESVEMANILCHLGFTDIVCTSHFLKGTYQNDPVKIRESALVLQNILYERNIPITLHASAEYRLDEHLIQLLDYPLPIENNIILIELPQYIQYDNLLEIIFRIIVEKKLRPLIAHPERQDHFDDIDERRIRYGLSSLTARLKSKYMKYKNHGCGEKRESILLATLRQMGCLFQANIGSFAGAYGKQVQNRALRILRAGFYDCLGSDAHGKKWLEHRIGKGMEIVEKAIDENKLSSMLMLTLFNQSDVVPTKIQFSDNKNIQMKQ